MNGNSICVCGSMPPGITYCPPASTIVAPAGASRSAPICRIVPPSCGSAHNTSARYVFSASIMVPPRIRVVMLPPPCELLVCVLPTSYDSSTRHARARSLAQLHPCAVYDRRQRKSHKPRIRIKRIEDRRHVRKHCGECGVQKARQIRQHADYQRNHRTDIPAPRIAVLAMLVEQLTLVQPCAANQEIVDHQNARHRTEQRR